MKVKIIEVYEPCFNTESVLPENLPNPKNCFSMVFKDARNASRYIDFLCENLNLTSFKKVEFHITFIDD